MESFPSNKEEYKPAKEPVYGSEEKKAFIEALLHQDTEERFKKFTETVQDHILRTDSQVKDQFLLLLGRYGGNDSKEDPLSFKTIQNLAERFPTFESLKENISQDYQGSGKLDKENESALLEISQFILDPFREEFGLESERAFLSGPPNLAWLDDSLRREKNRLAINDNLNEPVNLIFDSAEEARQSLFMVEQAIKRAENDGRDADLPILSKMRSFIVSAYWDFRLGKSKGENNREEEQEISTMSEPIVNTVESGEPSNEATNLPKTEEALSISLEPELSIEDPAFYRKENNTISLEPDISIEDTAFYRGPEKVSLEKESKPEEPSELDKLRGQITDIDKIIKEKRKSGVSSTDSEIVKLRKERTELSAKYWKDYLAEQKEREVSSPENKKEWEDLTPEERKEKYEKTFDLRKKVWNLRQARENLVLAETRAKRKGGGNSVIFIMELTEAKQFYEKARAEYVGAKAGRMMRESKAKALADIEKKSENKDAFEKLRKGWRHLGDLNISYFVEPKTKAGKIASRFFSVRSGISLTLLGASWATGFGSAVGMTALAARRVLGGVGAGFASYDSMRNFSEKKDTSIGEEEMAGLSISRLEEKLARFEGWARITGDRSVLNKDYDRLRRELAERVDEAIKENPGLVSMTDKLLSLDEAGKDGEKSLNEEERKRRWKAGAVGLASLVAFSWLGSGPESEVSTPSGAKEVATGTAGTVASEIPEKILEAAEAGLSGNQIIGTVEKGGNLWQAAKEMVKAVKITPAQFAEAWTNPNSVVKLAGEVRHISEAGLSHVGDQVIYVPGASGEAGHFEVVDYAKDIFHLGSNNELANEFTRVGKLLPNWLEKAQEAREAVSDAGPVSETLLAVPSESTSLEALSSYGHTPEINYLDFPNPDLESFLPEMLPNAFDPVVSGSGEALSFSWGEASWIINDLGHKYGLKFFDSPFVTAASRGRMVIGSIKEYLLVDYQEAITENASSFETTDETIAKITRTRESAYNIKRLMDICQALPSSERFPFRYFIEEIMKKVNKEAGVNIFKKIIIP